MIRVLVVDDHAPTRQQIIDELKSGNLITIVGEAETSDEAFAKAEKLLPDVVLLDLHLPGLLTPFNLIQKLTALRNVKVLVAAAVGVGADVQDLLESGAYGYVLKSDPPALIRMAIVMVSRGSRNIITPELPRQINHLTQEERAILKQVSNNSKLDKIAAQLGLSENRLTSTLLHLAQKLDLGTVANLRKWAKKNGF
jgi:two-component system, NarL family, response regulator DesR